MASSSRPHSLFKSGRFVIVLIGVALLVWFVARQAVAIMASNGSNPVVLTQFDPATFPDAGGRLAQLYLAAGRRDDSARIGRQAVLSDPMNVRSMRNLGLALQTSDRVASDRILRTAEQLSWRDTPLSLWALQDAARQADVVRVMDWVDALSRRQARPDITKQILVAAMADAPSREYLANYLQRKPAWRGSFFFGLVRNELPAKNLSDAARLLDAVDNTSSPVTPLERMALVDRMLDVGEIGQAHAYWANHFIRSSNSLSRTPFDPAFASAAQRGDRLPVSRFEWQIPPEADTYAYFRDAGERHVLQIDPGTRGGSPMIVQWMNLSPGAYRIDTTLETGDSSRSPVEWMVYCQPSGEALLRDFSERNDRLSGVEFTVPTRNCEGQRLVLAGQDQFDGRSLAIRSVSIR